MLIYAMLVLSVAMRDSGLVAQAAHALAVGAEGLSPQAVLSLVILAASVATEFLSNSAVAVLLTPLAIDVAHALGVDPRPFVVGVMLAASASFATSIGYQINTRGCGGAQAGGLLATPIGYQINTRLYAAGHCRFSNFARLGIPSNIQVWGLAGVFISLFWPL